MSKEMSLLMLSSLMLKVRVKSMSALSIPPRIGEFTASDFATHTLHVKQGVVNSIKTSTRTSSRISFINHFGRIIMSFCQNVDSNGRDSRGKAHPGAWAIRTLHPTSQK